MDRSEIAGAVGGVVETEVRGLAPVHGGDVASAFRVDLADGGVVFAKTHPSAPPGFFTTEAGGLAWLRGASPLLVPEVLGVSDSPPLLVLEWIDVARPAVHTDADLGAGLAELHATGARTFGREDRRRTGSRGLPNDPYPTWSESYAANRLLPLARMAAASGALSSPAITGLETLAGRLPEYGGDDEPPARLHGDLWAGNRLVDGRGANWLIDPAAHGGHREFDLAMMRLFGGFGDECFAAYDAAYPPTPGRERRMLLHQVAPLVIHAIKFAGSYRGASERAVAELLG